MSSTRLKSRRKLELETLEDRAVPATFRWNPDLNPANTYWHNSDNWEVKVGNNWDDALQDDFPGLREADVAEFSSVNTTNATINKNALPLLTFSTLRIDRGYTGTIEFGGTVKIKSEFTLNAPATLTSSFTNGAAVGRLELLSGSTGTIYNGELVDLSVRAQRNGNEFATLEFAKKPGENAANSGTRKLTSVNIEIDGKLNWRSGRACAL